MLLKTSPGDARLSRLDSTPPIRSRAPEEGSFEIPLWGVPLILALLYVCLFSGLEAIGLVGPDEPRYAAIARAMAETHDWVTPRLWGTPWFEKPVLYYWCAGAAMRVFGVSELAARLPSALAALLAVAAASWTALRSYGLGAASFTLLMLPTSVAMIGFSRAAAPDMLFAGLLTAAMAVACEMLGGPRPSAIQRIAFGFLLGAAVLAKGPAAVILAGGSVLLWAALSRHLRASLRFLHPLTIAAFCATALPWYILCAVRNPDFLRIFIWQHNFERYLTPEFHHRQPFWFYGPILILAVFPWVLFSVSMIPEALKSLRDKSYFDSHGVFFACWAAFPILFFSLSQSKLPGYILPTVPPLFVLMGNWISHSIQDKKRAALRALGWTGALLLLPSIPLSFEIRVRSLELSEYAVGSGVLVMFGIIIVFLSLRKFAAGALLALVLMVASTVEVANWMVLPRLNSQISARPLGQRLKAADPSGNDLATYELSRNWKYGLNFYFNRELPEWAPGSGEPKWILAGIPHRLLFSRYELETVEGNTEMGGALFLFHHR